MQFLVSNLQKIQRPRVIRASLVALGGIGLALAASARSENVGIGVLAPQAVLHVRGDANGPNDVIFQNLNTHTGANDSALVMIVDNADGQRVKTRPLIDLGGDGDWMQASTVDVPSNVSDDIWTIGKVGIGIMDPQVELDVLGTIAASGDVYSGGQFIASTYGQASDRRLKTDVQGLDGSLDLLRKLEPVQFRYATGTGLPADTQRLHYGVIAQQLARLDPELVSLFTPPGSDQAFLAVNTVSVVYLLADALQSLDTQVQAGAENAQRLRQENARLGGENLRLRQHLSALEQRLESLEGRLPAPAPAPGSAPGSVPAPAPNR